MKVSLFVLLLFLLPGLCSPLSAFDREEGAALVAHIVKRQPLNREVMFVEMLFAGPHRDILFDDDDLDSLAKMVRRTKGKRFQKEYAVDTKYRAWLLTNLEELKGYNASKLEDLLVVAGKMNNASLEMNDRLNNINKRNLLYLIQFAAGLPSGKTLTEQPFRISVGQLLPVLRAEYNSRQ